MSVQVLCPSCGEVTPFHRPPVTDCPRCHAPLPEQVRAATTRALAVEEAPKPMLLMLGQVFSLVGAVIVLGLLATAPFDVGSYTINGDAVSGPEFLRRAGWLFGLQGVLLGAIGVGLLRDAPWPRPLMVLYWVLIPVSFVFYDEINAEVIMSACMMLVAAGIAWWYLYQKSNVRAYFESRELSSTAHDA